MNSTNPSFESFYGTGPYEDLSQFSDSKLRTEDGYVFNVHRVTLARANRYFYGLFHWMGNDKTDFLVPGIKGTILEKILLHIYKGTIHLTESNIYELMVASDYLQADNIMLEINQFANHNISLNNCIPLYTTALMINNEDILRGSYRYIQTHFEVLVSQVDIDAIPFESMKQFLGDKNLCVSGEHIIWFAIVKWTQGNITNRICHVPDFLQSLKFSDIDDSLAKEIVCHDIVAKNNFCKDLKAKAECQSRKIRKSKAEGQSRKEISKEDFENIILREYYMKLLVRPTDFYSHRQPKWMHLIARHHDHNNKDGVQVFITYDEGLDVWRKLGETYFYPDNFISIGRSVYIFDSCSKSGIEFNIFEKRWRNMNEFEVPDRSSYLLVNLNNLIYVIGGIWENSGEEVMDVEKYCPEMGTWSYAESMIPIKSYSAVVFQDNIYVVGKSPEDVTMMAQVYDANSNSWAMFSPPVIYRSDFTLVTYHGKLYIVGGSSPKEEEPFTSELIKKVERFDFERNAWEAIEDLPHTYYMPKAIVLNDRLIVFEDSLNLLSYQRKNPSVMWNETNASWELLDDNSLASNDLAWYHFCTIDDSESIAALTRENRDPRTQLEKSPFN